MKLEGLNIGRLKVYDRALVLQRNPDGLDVHVWLIDKRIKKSRAFSDYDDSCGIRY